MTTSSLFRCQQAHRPGGAVRWLAATMSLCLIAVLIPAMTNTAAAAAQVSTCLGHSVTVQIGLGQVPTANDDVIVGTEGDDLIAASDGNDVICGLGGNDIIWGQDGDDTIDGGDGDDKLRGGNGNDSLLGGLGSDDLNGGRGNDSVAGGAGPDAKVRGGTGDDIVDGGSGRDVLVAGNGGSDDVTGGRGNDELVTGGPRPDVVRGGDGNDLVKGNGGADKLFGDAGDDDIRGGPQPDEIDGGPGIDACNGGVTGNGAPESDSARNCESHNLVELIASQAVGGRFAITDADSGLVLALDGLGPQTWLAGITGSTATWISSTNADGTVSLINELTGESLAVRDGQIVVVSDDNDVGRWTLIDAGGGGFVLAIDGQFLVAAAPNLSLTSNEQAATNWRLVDLATSATAVMITNAASGSSLTGTSADQRSIVRVGPGQGLARGYWTFSEIGTSGGDCSLANSAPTCAVIRNNELGGYLDADENRSENPIKTTARLGIDSVWHIEEAVDDTFTIRNVDLDAYLNQDSPRSVNLASNPTQDSRWTFATTSLDASSCPDTAEVVTVDSHSPGQDVDLSLTGSFMLSGTAPRGTTSVSVALNGMAAEASLDPGNCSVGWAIEASPMASGTAAFDITAAGSAGTQAASIVLQVTIAPAEEPLLTPEAAAAPDLGALLISYDAATGTLIFMGEVADELMPGDILAGEVSDEAPDGYLRAVEDISFDGTNTIVMTRQAALTEFVRQLNVVYQGALADNPAFDVVAPFDPEEDGTIDEQGPGGQRIAQGNSPRSVDGRGGDPAFNPEGALDFSIDPDLDIDIDVDWNRNCWYCLPVPTLERFLTEAYVAIDVKASIQINRVGGFDSGLRFFGPELDDYKLGVITLPTPIPIIITVELDMQAFYTAQLNAAFKAEFVWNAEAVAGYEHLDNGNGRGAYSDLIVPGSPVPTYDFDLGLIGSVAFGVEIELAAKLYGSAGVEFQVRPQIEAEVTADLIDRVIKFEGKFKMPISSGIEIDLIVTELEFGEIEFINIEYGLWELEWTVDSAEVAIVDPDFPFASARQPYAYQFEATGEAPFVWEPVDLPPGFTLSPSGLLQGTPGTAGPFTFAIRVAAANEATTSNQYVLRVVETEVGSGRLQFTLRWDDDNDMDLHVFEPDGTEIWFRATGPTASGGRLDRDDNVSVCGIDEVPGGVENIFWPSESGAPIGNYRIVIDEWRRCDGNPASGWTLEAFSESALVLSRTGVGEADLTFSYSGPAVPLAG